MATKQQVIDLNLAHPDWTARQVAEHLNCRQEYVGSCKRRYGLQFAKSKRRIAVKPDSVLALGREARRAGLNIEIIRKVGQEMRAAQ